MQRKLISCFSFLGHGWSLSLSLSCYLTVAPVNHATNLCCLFQTWKFKTGEFHRWRSLDYKLETHPQSWLVGFTGSRFVVIIMCSCPLSAVNSWISCKHFHWADVLIEQIFPVEYCVKARAHYTAKYLVLIRRLNITNCVHWGKLSMALSVSLVIWKVRLMINDYLIALS